MNKIIIQPNEIRFEVFTFDKTQVIDLGNPAEVEFINNSYAYNVAINNNLILTNKLEYQDGSTLYPYNWQHKFSAYPNEINKTQFQIRFDVTKKAPPGEKPMRMLTVICKYYVYN